MTAQNSAEADQERSARQVTERAAWSVPGVRVLVAGIAALLAGIVLLVLSGTLKPGATGLTVLAVIGILLVIAGIAAMYGLTAVVAGEARVVQLFGRYRGTIRDPGLHWVNPIARRRKVSVRIRNHETAVAKVNDADGNPIEIAAVVVWQVHDTAKALYSVDDFPTFVAIQTETAVRHTASSYPYTSHDYASHHQAGHDRAGQDRDSRNGGGLSLRDNAAEVTQRLSAEIAERVRPAGVHIVESRLTRLSYAPEIAQAMLRQQQANAVVGARQRIVEGAVGMVQLALNRLEEQDVVSLDEERKAAMVSNLLVVLCSEQATQQVVNAGTLYQ
jgi:regulator of protease activity HflC (stomatin/prohibitin superfamily)